MWVVLTLLSVAHGQTCGQFTGQFPDRIRFGLGAQNTPFAVNFVNGQRQVIVNGGAVGFDVNASGGVIQITDFGSVVAAPSVVESGATRPVSTYLTLGLVGLACGGARRVEPGLVVGAGALLSMQYVSGQSSCVASVTVAGSTTVGFAGDVTGRVTVSCPGDKTIYHRAATDDTIVACATSFQATYTKAFSSPSNDPGCAAIAPATVEVTEGTPSGRGILKFNSQTASYNGSTNSGRVAELFPPPFGWINPTLYEGVVLSTGAAPVDLLLEGVDVREGYGSGIMPVTMHTAALTCKFGYTCSAGSCEGFKAAYSNTCVEYGFVTPPPTPCSNSSQVPNCNCTFQTCLHMCPNFNCSAERACNSSTDQGTVWPCEYCSCCSAVANTGSLMVVPAVSFFAAVSFLFFVS